MQCALPTTFTAHPKIDYDSKYRETQFVKAGSSLIISTNISGVPTPSTTWQKDGEPLAPSDNILIDSGDEFSTLTIKSTRKDTGTYKITAENEIGSDEAEFDVKIRGKCDADWFQNMFKFSWEVWCKLQKL